jgi:8-oxo-dGTP pyrophosphatase MutT (NUDIX family)
LDAGESLRAAVQRECQEEAGVKVDRTTPSRSCSSISARFGIKITPVLFAIYLSFPFKERVAASLPL